jgi:hypothetical protein
MVALPADEGKRGMDEKHGGGSPFIGMASWGGWDDSSVRSHALSARGTKWWSVHTHSRVQRGRAAAVRLGHAMPLSIALGQAELEEGSTIRAHEMEKRAPVHGDYALARQRPR